MAGKRITTSSINWADFFKRVTEDEVQHFRKLKFRNDSYVRRIAAHPEVLPKIDWNYYKNNISIPGIVDSVKQKYESLTVPYPTDLGLLSQIDDEEKTMVTDYGKVKKDTEEQMENYKKVLAKLESELRYSEMTVEEYSLARPEEALYPFGKPTLYPHNQEDIDYTEELIRQGKLKN